ncbi:MAG: hypothetical protein E7597_01165 [Ruminococcaceae bacterium]|nr:hypothetical protein [Oscillospiraceae bacterium]
MNYHKRLISFMLVVAMMISTVCTFSFATTTVSAIADADFVAPEIYVPDYLQLPDNDLLTNNTSFMMAEGTRHEIQMKTEFIVSGKKNRPGTINSMKYVVVHNTGAYPVTSTSLANHNYGRTTTASVSWHYTCGNDGLYQMLPVNEMGWHAGGNYWSSTTEKSKYNISDLSNSTGIGIETATDGFPADATFSGEHWNQADMYDWYASHFDKTATYLAMLVAFICVKLNFNPYTQVYTHYHAAGKNCPIQMRYVFGTNASFSVDGTYYKVFRDRMYDYYKAFGGSYVSTDTVKNTYYNPNYKYYKPGLYKANSSVTVYRAGNSATGSVGTIASGTVVDAKITGWDWGKVTLSNGTVGWVDLDNFTYVRNDYDYGTYRTSSGSIVNVTNISGSTATYNGGTANISTLTRVYKVSVKNDTTFGSTVKYLAKGETFTVTAATSSAGLFDIWEVKNGIATITDKTAKTTTVKVLNSDIELEATYRTDFDLSITYGVGSGRYAAGTVVNISASTRTGYSFTHWSIESGSGTFGDANSYNTTFTIGSSDAVIKANYETAGEIDTTGLTNYALNKSYTTTWKGSTDITYQYTNQQDTNRTKLTDGSKATDSYNTTDTPYVSFQGTTQKFGTTIDLGAQRNFRMVAICDFGDSGSSVGDYQTNSAEIEYSTDGVTYHYVENLVDTLLYSYVNGSALSNVYTHKVDFAWVTARYVRVTFTSASYVTAFTEIEVYGSDNVVVPEPEPEPDPVLELTTSATADGYSMDESYLYGGDLAMDVNTFKALFTVDVTVKNLAGNAVSSGYIGTGYTVNYNDTVIEVVVAMDLDGSATCNTTDMLMLRKYISKRTGVTSAGLKASDGNGDTAVNTTDLVIMRKFIATQP